MNRIKPTVMVCAYNSTSTRQISFRIRCKVGFKSDFKMSMTTDG